MYSSGRTRVDDDGDDLMILEKDLDKAECIAQDLFRQCILERILL